MIGVDSYAGRIGTGSSSSGSAFPTDRSTTPSSTTASSPTRGSKNQPRDQCNQNEENQLPRKKSMLTLFFLKKGDEWKRRRY